VQTCSAAAGHGGVCVMRTRCGRLLVAVQWHASPSRSAPAPGLSLRTTRRAPSAHSAPAAVQKPQRQPRDAARRRRASGGRA
jgi:hypothetical protein